MRFWVIISTLVFCFSGCSKKEGTHITIPQEFKDVGYFKTNSWWIYRNESTKTTDCTYVKTDLIFDAKSETSTHETIYLTYGGNYFKSAEIVSYGYSLRSVNGATILMLNNNNVIDTLYNYRLNELVFPVVFHSIDMHPGTNDTTIFNFYLAPHVGLVKFSKKESNTDTTFSLVKYSIIQ